MRGSVNVAMGRMGRTGTIGLCAGLLAAVAAIAGGCGGSNSHVASAQGPSRTSAGTISSLASPTPPPPPPPPPPALVVKVPPHYAGAWRTVALVHGHAAAWLAEREGVTLMRFDQRFVRLDLHAGSSDGGESGWRYGDRIAPREVHKVIAAFNGGFKLTYANVGFLAGGHVAVALKPGLGSIVTYTDGTTGIGAWHAGVPDPARTVYSVLQNQRLLVDAGTPAANAETCIVACWGETIGSATSVARSGLGITSSGQLVWAAAEQLTPGQLARALVKAGAVRAVELDINPFWVAGYLYAHGRSGPAPVPVVPGQHGIAGELLEADARDFFTIVANR